MATKMAVDVKKKINKKISASLPPTERITLMFGNVGTGDYKPVTRVWLQGAIGESQDGFNSTFT